MKVPQTRDELLAHLADQVQFLSASAEAFDRGLEGEAKRLAVALRILLHDTRNQRSLLGQLSVKDALRFDDVVGPEPPNAKLWSPMRMSFGEKGMIYRPR